MKRFIFILCCAVSLFSFNSCANNYSDININIDDEVRSVFSLTNKFRTGNEAVYWNQDDTTKTSMVGKLNELTLDEDLCKVATIRANEIVQKFAHERPNGKSCFTVYEDLGIKVYSRGENIAAGSKTGQATFLQWKEDNKKYDGQGHRRNMLSEKFTKIGIAYTYASDSEYKYYWVMVLAK